MQHLLISQFKPQDMLVQVVPTVGVDKDENGKGAAAQMKHFRNLVDETASKANFLASMRRTESPSMPLADDHSLEQHQQCKGASLNDHAASTCGESAKPCELLGV